jgi:hypothetical protein
LKKRQVTSPITPPANPGVYAGNTHLLLEIHRKEQLAWKRYKLAQAATKKMIFHAFKDYHFLELQDDNGDIIGYTAMELFDHLMDQYVQPEDVANQITALHQILEQNYDPNEEPQVYYKAVQDARNTLESLNETVKESTLIRHGLTGFLLWRQYWRHFLGYIFTGAYLPQKLVLAPPLERQYISV